MNERERHLQTTVAQGWLVLAGLILTLMVSDLMQGAIKADFTEFAHHPGPEEWGAVCVYLSVYFVLSVSTRLVGAVWYRWASALFLALITFGTASHTVEHMLAGDKVYGIYAVVDAAHAVVGVALTVVAVLWARSKSTEQA
jgi:hypothetical protein